MEMLVTKFSKGKYRNESELFSEPISDENVKLMGEMIALQLFRTRKKHYCMKSITPYPTVMTTRRPQCAFCCNTKAGKQPTCAIRIRPAKK